jgi:hypothetical protein
MFGPYGLLNQTINPWFDPQKMDPNKVPLGLLSQPQPDMPAPQAVEAGPMPQPGAPMQLPSADGGPPAAPERGLLSSLGDIAGGLGKIYGQGGPGDGLINLGLAIASPGNMAQNLAKANETTTRGRMMNWQMGQQQAKQQGQAQTAQLLSQKLGITPQEAMGLVQSGAADNILANQFKTQDPTSDQQNYQAYVNDEMKAGRAPISFNDWRLQGKRAGATQVNVGAGENEFDKAIAKGQADMFGEMAKDAITARSDISRIGALRSNIEQLPGGFLGGAQALANQYGIKIGPNASNVEAANAIISQLVPTQRVPGSGTTSDRDLELFKASLPRLSNTREGNALILDTMEGMARYKQAQGEIATAVMTGQMSRQDGVKRLQALEDPFAKFKKAVGGASPAAPTALPGGWSVERVN